MIITKDTPFTKEEIEKLREEFDMYIKTVIDIEKRICSAGANRHFDSEQLLLEEGSKQSSLWGGGIDLETKVIDYNSFINIRPGDNNVDRHIESESVRNVFCEISEHFFKTIL